MQIRFIVVGKPSGEYAPIIHDYEKRLPKYCRFEVFEVKNDSAIMCKVKGAMAVLDIAGKEFSSEKLAEWLKKEESVTFIIGGAEGLSTEIREKAGILVSLTKMTLPHQLARLVLTEQVYRAFTIIKGEKYHK